MPWDGCELFVARPRPGRHAERPHRTSPGATARSRSGSRSGARRATSSSRATAAAGGTSSASATASGGPLHPAEAEFGYPAWVFGARSYAFLGDGRIVCGYDRDGRTCFGVLDPETGELERARARRTTRWRGHAVRRRRRLDASSSSRARPRSRTRSSGSTLATGDARGAPDERRRPGRPGVLLRPARDRVPDGGRADRARALLSAGEPRLRRRRRTSARRSIVMSHGGPDRATRRAIFDLDTQFWTSRGSRSWTSTTAGSTGYGRAYRERLNGQWGVVDLAGLRERRPLPRRARRGRRRPAAHHAEAAPAATRRSARSPSPTSSRPARRTSGSPTSSSSADGETHKFELQYEHTLVGPYPEAAELYRERSPINFVDRISTPMLVLQGADDEIVPPDAGRAHRRALRERGVPHAYLLFEGEGHGFRKAENIVALARGRALLLRSGPRLRAGRRRPDARDRAPPA